MITDELIEGMAAKCLLTDDEFDDVISTGRGKRIQTVNLHHLALAASSDEFTRTIEQADYVTADGWPIVRLLRSHGVDAQRVTGSEFVARMLGSRKFHGKKAAILGADRMVGHAFRGKLHDSGLHVVFREHGDRASWRPAELAAELESEHVDLLIVAVTPPYGDAIGEQVRQAGFCGVVVNVGGAVNMAAGAVSMAPAWVRATKIEWLYRLALEPRRLWRRYIIECLPVFARHVLPSYVRRAEKKVTSAAS